MTVNGSENMNWEEFEAAGGTWDEFVDDVMHGFLGEIWDEINKEG